MSLHDAERFLGLKPIGSDQTGQRSCANPGCCENGDFRAPKSRNREDGHLWFCLEHIREYNAAWNYYEGMNEQQIEAHRREDVTWQRPTWKLGTKGTQDPFSTMRDDLGLFGARPSAYREQGQPPRATSPEERKSLDAMGLQAGASWPDVRRRYKELVKRYHPDANGGDLKAEDRLKRVTAAYAHLASCGYS
jgi:curved DNA-binding protein CbpA